MSTVYASSDGCFQQDDALCHKVQIICNWFFEHDHKFTKYSQISKVCLWDVVELKISIMDLQHDAVTSVRTKTFSA